MEDSYNSYSNIKKEIFSDFHNTDSNYNIKNRFDNKTNSFYDYDFDNTNNQEFNDFLGNSDIKYNFENNNKIIINENENDNNNENDYGSDISSEDEYESKLKQIKLGILTSKLNILIKIIYAKIQKYYYFFISKLKLKIKSIQIFLQGDNFLYTNIRSKTSEVNKYYAFKKIIYIFRKNKYEKIIKKSFFNKWKLIKNKYYYDEKEKIYAIKALKFNSILIKILNQRLEKEYQNKYYLSKWDILTKYNDIHKTRIIKAMLILSNLFSRKLKFVFKKFPRNYLNLKNKENIFKKKFNNKQITYIIEDKDEYYQKGLIDFCNIKKKYKFLLKQNKLLKIVEKLNIKNSVNKNTFLFFGILKNYTRENKYKKEQVAKIRNILNDLKFDSMLNATTMIKTILNEYITNDLFIYKKYFLQKLYSYNKFIRLYNLYKKNYKGIVDELNNKDVKEEILYIRNIYRKVFALQKILIINNRHKLFFGDLNIQLKNSLIQKYFNAWKHNTLNISIDKYLKELGTQKLFLFLYDILFNKIKRASFYFIKKRSIQKTFNDKKYCYLSYYLYLYLKNHILINQLKEVFYFVKNIDIKKNSKKLKKDSEFTFYLKSKKIYLLYRKHLYLIKWHFIASFISESKNKFKIKIKNLLINNDNKNNQELSTRLFNKWRENTYINYENDQIINNQRSFYLNKFISMKTLMLKWLHFKKWLITYNESNDNTENVLTYENLLTELSQLRKENDDLTAIYCRKRQEYAKTLYDYNYMKKYYCEKCINENEDEIDYMSLKSDDIKEAGKMSNSLLISQNKLNFSKDQSKNTKSKNFDDKNENDNTKIKASIGISSDGNNFIVNEENRLQSSNSIIISLSEDEDNNSRIGKKIPQCAGETILSKNLFLDNNSNNVINSNNNKSKNKENEEEENSKESIIKEYQKEYEEQQKYYENYIKILLEKKNELMQMKNMLQKQKNENLKLD